jgi:hypothetical protein
MKRSRVGSTTLGPKPNKTAFNVYVPVNVEPGFRQAAPLVSGDLKTTGEEIAFGTIRQSGKVSPNKRNRVKRQSRLLANILALYAKLPAWIGQGKASPNRLLHNQPERLDLQQGRVVPGSVLAGCFFGLFPPCNVGEAVGPLKLAGSGNPSLAKEQPDSFPCNLVAQETFAAVAINQKPPNPLFPYFMGCAGVALLFLKATLGRNLLCLALVATVANAKAGGFSLDFPAIPILNPPNITTFIKARHMTVPQCAQSIKNGKINWEICKRYITATSVALSRRFNSVSSHQPFPTKLCPDVPNSLKGGAL